MKLLRGFIDADDVDMAGGSEEVLDVRGHLDETAFSGEDVG